LIRPAPFLPGALTAVPSERWRLHARQYFLLYRKPRKFTFRHLEREQGNCFGSKMQFGVSIRPFNDNNDQDLTKNFRMHSGPRDIFGPTVMTCTRQIS
jgi:hypothetical protein